MRELRLIDAAIDAFGLDLRDIRVLTEAASGAFRWTALLAARAGARSVLAVGADSRYGRYSEVTAEMRDAAERLGVADRITFQEGRQPGDAAGIELVTNLGFVRPIDAATVEALARPAVVCLMWEPWEFRADDLDLAACRERGVPVLGTNERDPRLQTFSYVGLSVLRLLLEREIEIRRSRIGLLGAGPFVDETREVLVRLGAEVVCAPATALDGHFDALVALEHHERERMLAGSGGLASGVDGCDLFLHVCGRVDAEWIRARGWPLVPDEPAAPGRMSFTTAVVGPRPVIELHAAGLRVGQASLRGETSVLDALALPLPEA